LTLFVKIQNVELITKNSTAVEFYNTRNLEVTGLKTSKESSGLITVNGNKSSDIIINNALSGDMQNFVEVGKEVPEGAVKL